ncbi:MAG TPA: hypothetical protein VN317_00130 [Candidatus Methanoperedens sp.]|nr:hypothetical protein [Candidatus Methanoperedens sp.]
MTGAGSPQRPPGPKTLLRTGAAFSPFVMSAANCIAGQVLERGVAVRRALAEEIRAQAVRPARTKRRR